MNSPGPADLARRVEEACLNGWPALREVVFDGWLLRFADGHTRRVNSVNPIGPGSRDMREKVQYCETIYAAQGLPAIFRIPSIALPGLDAVLNTLGYAPAEDETRVLYAVLGEQAGVAHDIGAAEIVEGAPSEEWLGAYARLTGQGEPARLAHRKILQALSLPAAFAAIRSEDGGLASLAFGAMHHRIVCVNSVVTDVSRRRRGLSRLTVSAVLAWARGLGAEGACLPVAAANAAAIALYEGLGFRTEMYRYHYRRAAARRR